MKEINYTGFFGRYKESGDIFTTFRLADTLHDQNERCGVVKCKPGGNHRCIDVKDHGGEHQFFWKTDENPF